MPTYKNYFNEILTDGGTLISGQIDTNPTSQSDVMGTSNQRYYYDIERLFGYVPGAFVIPNNIANTETKYLVATLINGNKLYYENTSSTVNIYYEKPNGEIGGYLYSRSPKFSNLTEDVVLIMCWTEDTLSGDYGRYGAYLYYADSSYYYMYWNCHKGNESQYFGFIDGAVPPAEYHNGAGSGYIGNALLSNKKMVGYNVPTSSAESTKTESVNTYSANAEANKPKAGNGAVRIKWLRELTFDWTCDSQYLYEGANTLLAKYDVNWYRDWTKYQAYKTLAVWAKPTNRGYNGLIQISDKPEGCSYVTSGLGTQTTAYSYLVDGHRWYISNWATWIEDNIGDASPRPPLFDMSSYDISNSEFPGNAYDNTVATKMIALIRDILNAANVRITD